jgi:hypothetical protein
MVELIPAAVYLTQAHKKAVAPGASYGLIKVGENILSRGLYVRAGTWLVTESRIFFSVHFLIFRFL